MTSCSRMLAFLFLVSVCGGIAAAEEAGPDLPTRVLDYGVGYFIRDDGSYDETRRIAVKILKASAIGGMKQHSIAYSTSVQKAEVLEAYTEKRDGRRIDAPKSNFQVEAHSGNGPHAPAFSDWTTLTAVFPDVEVDDTVVLAYRLTSSEPIFPGHFSAIETFPATGAFDHVRVTVDAPASLWLQHRARRMQEVVSEQGNRRIAEWTYENPNPAKSKRFDYSAYDVEQEPGVAVSTFRSHAEIAAAYGIRATPKAKPTERIAKLAAEISGDRTDPREIARVLYEWVATNITYGGNCVGLGAVVPRDTDVVIDNRMGDCKDHATLLQALLAAKGIASTQALVNSGSAYRLPAVPVVPMVNHVINFIPSQNLFLDSTSDDTPFGMLPFGDQDKPALLVDGYRDGLKTPAYAAGQNRQLMKSTITILADGSVKGNVAIELNGRYAAQARARLRHMTKEVQDNLVKNMFREMGFSGSGSFEKDDPKALLDSYRYGASFEVKNLIQYPGTGGFAIAPYLYNQAPIWGYIGGALQADEVPDESACSSGHSTEEYTFILPKAMKVLAMPDNVKVKNHFLTYEGTYSRKGNVLKVRRMMDDRTRGNLCDRKLVEDYRSFAGKVLPNLKAQVIYR